MTVRTGRENRLANIEASTIFVWASIYTCRAASIYCAATDTTHHAMDGTSRVSLACHIGTEASRSALTINAWAIHTYMTADTTNLPAIETNQCGVTICKCGVT